MKKIHILLLALCAVCVQNVMGQGAHRTFNYVQAPPSDSVASVMYQIPQRIIELRLRKQAASKHAKDIMSVLYRDSIDESTRKNMLKELGYDKSYTPDSLEKVSKSGEVSIAEKIKIVKDVLGSNRERMAAVGKAFVDQDSIADAAEAVQQALSETFPHYPYGNLLRAYIAQRRALRMADATDNNTINLRNGDMTEAASVFEEMAKTVRDSMPMHREWLMLAGEFRYQGNDGDNAREDFNQVLALHPSHQDSLDIAVMLAYFDRSQANVALKDSNRVEAKACWERAMEAYRRYFAEYRELPRDKYTMDIVEDYLLCLSNVAGTIKEMSPRKDDLSGFYTLLKEVDKYIDYNPRNISMQRYKASCYFQMCTTDTLQFPRYKDAYREAIAYVVDGSHPAENYTYSDYNYTQQWATYAKDMPMRAKYLGLCYETFDDVNRTRTEKGVLLESHVKALQAAGDYMGEIHARELAVKELLKDNPDAEVAGNEIHLAEAYMNVIVQQAQELSMSVEQVDSLAQVANEIVNRYLGSSNNSHADAAAVIKKKICESIFAVVDTDVRHKYYVDYCDSILPKLALWRNVFEKDRYEGQVSNLMSLSASCFKYPKAVGFATATGDALKTFLYIYNEEGKSESDKKKLDIRLHLIKDFLAPILGAYRANFVEAEPNFEQIVAICDTFDVYMRALTQGNDLDAVIHDAMFGVYGHIRQYYVLGNITQEQQDAFDRARFLSNYAKMEEDGKKVYLRQSVIKGKVYYIYEENIYKKNKNLSRAESKLLYELLAYINYAQGAENNEKFYAKGREANALSRANQISKAKKAIEERKALDAAFKKEMEDCYYFSYKAIKAGSTDCAGLISELEDMSALSDAIEAAQDRISLDKIAEQEKAEEEAKAAQAAAAAQATENAAPEAEGTEAPAENTEAPAENTEAPVETPAKAEE